MPRKNFISASQVACLMVDGNVRKPFGRGAISYARRLARESLDIEADSINSVDIDRGNELEDEAIDWFQHSMFFEGKRPDFLVHPEIAFFGGTPDWMNDEFGIDIKCPNQKNHHDNLREGIQLKKYKHQFQSYMAIAGYNKWGLVSYNNSFPENNRMAISWMQRDQKYINKLEDRVRKFYPIFQEELEKLKQYKL